MRNKLTSFLAVLLLISVFSCSGNSKNANVKKVTLRSQSATRSKDEVLQMVKTKGFNWPAEKIKGKFQHKYELQTIGEIKVVIDHATGLMWQQAEESSRLNWREVEAYIDQKNKQNLAGFSDWRLPTVEELLSLMETKKKGDYYLDPVFHKELLNTWTVDIVKDAFAGAWFVNFSQGQPSDVNRAFGMGHVRLVRSVTPAQKAQVK